MKSVSILLVAIFSSSAVMASPLAMEWRARHSKVVCGGTVEGQELDMQVSVVNEVMKAEAGRFVIFIDLHKEGQIRWVLGDAMTDQEYAQREAMLAKLSPDEQVALKSITASRLTDLYTGMNPDGFVHIMQTANEKVFSLSCQEIKN